VSDQYVCEKCGAVGPHQDHRLRRRCDVCGGADVSLILTDGAKGRDEYIDLSNVKVSITGPHDPEIPFLRAILADPDDDAPRLIFADWLEDVDCRHPFGLDPECAEFIRVQCELTAKYPGWEGQPAGDSLLADGPYATLRRREKELLLATKPGQWSGFPAEFTLLHTVFYQFRRGFVHWLRCEACDWLAHADSILAAQPVREVVLTTWPVALGQDGEWYLMTGSPGGGYVRKTGVKLPKPTFDGLGTNVRDILAAEWPDVTFTLPPGNRVTP
jgi:uncharacterized protein (TIGR02996 family)